MPSELSTRVSSNSVGTIKKGTKLNVKLHGFDDEDSPVPTLDKNCIFP